MRKRNYNNVWWHTWMKCYKKTYYINLNQVTETFTRNFHRVRVYIWLLFNILTFIIFISSSFTYFWLVICKYTFAGLEDKSLRLYTPSILLSAGSYAAPHTQWFSLWTNTLTDILKFSCGTGVCVSQRCKHHHLSVKRHPSYLYDNRKVSLFCTEYYQFSRDYSLKNNTQVISDQNNL